MEQEEDYSVVVNILKDLEHQYSIVADASLEKEYNQAKKSIEEHFQACIEAITARKESVLREAEEKYLEQSKVTQDLQTSLRSSIDGCKKILDTGALLYNDKKGMAIGIWKSIDILPSISQTDRASGIAIDFSHMLLDDIKIHGTVYTRSGEGSTNTSLSSSSSSLRSSGSADANIVVPSKANEEDVCVICSESFSADSNHAGHCAHKGTWHKKDKCKKNKCKKDSNSYHWSCCDSDKYTTTCAASGQHVKPKQCLVCTAKYLYTKPGECFHKGSWHTCLAECSSKCIGLGHQGKQHWSCCNGIVRNEAKCSKSEHVCK